MNKLIYQFLTAFAVGAVLMLVLSFTVYRKSYYYKKARAEALGIKEKPGLLSRLVTVMISLAAISFITLFDLAVRSQGSYSWAVLLALNLALVTLLSLFDALFIDLFLLVVWRPALLRLPEGQPTRDAMIRHIKRQFTFGWIFKVPIALVSTILALLFSPGPA